MAPREQLGLWHAVESNIGTPQQESSCQFRLTMHFEYTAWGQCHGYTDDRAGPSALCRPLHSTVSNLGISRWIVRPRLLSIGLTKRTKRMIESRHNCQIVR